ncbi:hypothetical protein JW707_03075 [Candidatus Woesearchaeota archaeon]|nr:hypothetical protein [Candidatus Woesearchaeota archaeon]
MSYKVCKFGGSSLATRELLDNAIDIMQADPSRKVAVVSACGKTTNNLIAGLEGKTEGFDSAKDIAQKVGKGHDELVAELYDNLQKRIDSSDANNRADSVKAWGEYASAKLMTAVMQEWGINAVFMEQKELGLVAYLDQEGDAQPDPDYYPAIGEKLESRINEGAIVVVPGYYAYTKEGTLVTLPRGGSDTIGAVIANALNAEVYENWTDVDGLSRARPDMLKKFGIEPEIISEITYAEARELAYADFKLQSEALIPVMPKHIPIHVRSSKDLSKTGTLIVHTRIVPCNEYIVGVAAKTGYVPITVWKPLMNKEVGFGLDVLRILSEEMGISYEHSPTGIDDVQFIIEKAAISKPGSANLFSRRVSEIRGAHARVEPTMAMVVVAGLGMRQHVNTDARVLTALAKQGIQQLMLNKGASQVSSFIGVEESRYADAVAAIYSEFYGKK